MDRIDAMKVFIATLDEGSLAGAGRRLGRSPALGGSQHTRSQCGLDRPFFEGPLYLNRKVLSACTVLDLSQLRQ
ncbi:LysR family transcriptional regulator [Caballeronia turbans]|jgi:hypothetical protein|nr:LysR family transcriptional regulator [Caballeronia turbans]